MWITMIGLLGLAAYGQETAPNVYVDAISNFRLTFAPGWQESPASWSRIRPEGETPAQAATPTPPGAPTPSPTPEAVTTYPTKAQTHLVVVNPSLKDDKAYLFVDVFEHPKAGLSACCEATRAYLHDTLKADMISDQFVQVGDLPARQMVYINKARGREYMHTMLFSGSTLYIVHGASSVDGFPKVAADFAAMTDSLKPRPR